MHPHVLPDFICKQLSQLVADLVLLGEFMSKEPRTVPRPNRYVLVLPSPNLDGDRQRLLGLLWSNTLRELGSSEGWSLARVKELGLRKAEVVKGVVVLFAPLVRLVRRENVLGHVAHIVIAQHHGQV